MSLLDDMLADASAEDQRLEEASPPSLFEQKLQAVEQKTVEKEAKIEPAKIMYQTDADTTKFYDQSNSMRAKGFDAYEVAHYNDPTSPTYNTPEGEDYRRREENRLMRQRERLAMEKGVDPSEITNQDVWRRGARENLISLYNKTKSPTDRDRNGILRGEEGYQEWQPGPISNDWYTATADNPEPARIGSPESPLDIVVGRRISSGDAQGRSIGEEFNINDQENGLLNVNDQMTNADNVQVFGADGKFDPIATEDRKAKLAGWQGTPPSQITDEKEQDQYDAWANEDQGTLDEFLGRVAGMEYKNDAEDAAMQAAMAESGLRTGNKEADAQTAKLVDTLQNREGLGDYLWNAITGREHEGGFQGTGMKYQDLIETDNQGKENKSAEYNRDLLTGVSNKSRRDQKRAMKIAEDEFKKGNYKNFLAAAGPQISNMLGESLPEMKDNMLPLGSVIVASRRANQYANEFKKNNNGKDASAEQIAAMVAWETANLAVEKGASMLGLKKLKDMIVKKWGKSFLQKTGLAIGGLAGGTAFEGVQEGAENVSQEYMTQSQEEGKKKTLEEIVTSDKTKFSAAIGATMGAAVTGGGMATGTAVKATISTPGYLLNKNLERKVKKAQKLNDEQVANLSDDDYKLERNSLIDATKGLEENDKTINKTIEVVSNAESIEDIENSGNIDLKEAVNNQRKTAIDNEEEVAKTEAYVEATARLFGRVSRSARTKKKVIADLGLEETATDEEIASAMGKTENVKAMLIRINEMDRSGNNTVENIANEVVSNNFEKTKEQMLDIANTIKEENDKKLKIVKDSVASFDAARMKSRDKGISGRRKDEKIDTKDEAFTQAKDPSTIGEAVAAIVGSVTGSNKKQIAQVEAKLSEYSDEAIQAAIDEAGKKSIISKVGKRVIKNRAKAIKMKTNPHTYADKKSLLKDATFSMGPNSKTKNLQKIKKLVSQDEIVSTDEAKAIGEMIDGLVKRKQITKNQAKVLKKRLDNRSKNASREFDSDFKGHNPFPTKQELSKKFDDAQKEIDSLNEELKTEQDPDNIADIKKEINALKSDMRNFQEEYQYADDDAQTTPKPQPKPKKTQQQQKPKPQPQQTQQTKTEDTEKEQKSVTYGEYEIVKNDSNGFDVLLNGKKVTGSSYGGIQTAKDLADKHASKTAQEQYPGSDPFENDQVKKLNTAHVDPAVMTEAAINKEIKQLKDHADANNNELHPDDLARYEQLHLGLGNKRTNTQNTTNQTTEDAQNTEEVEEEVIEPSQAAENMSYNKHEINENMDMNPDDTLGEEMSMEEFLNKKCKG